MNIRRLLPLFFLVAASAPGEPAAVCPVKAPAPSVPLALTVSGGVSLGSYEAGYLYYSTELFKLNRGYFDPKIITGASAGSINALVSVLSLCSEAARDPQKSLFWDAWMDVGFKDLSRPDQTSALALFSRDVLRVAASKIERQWAKGLKETCDMVLGISTTRRDPVRVEIARGFDVTRQEEKFVLRIKGRGAGRAPALTNYVDPLRQLPQPLLHLPHDERQVFPALRSLLFASSAFPLAFSPQKLDYCLVSGKPVDCEGRVVKSDYFVDGGVFDNQPLRLAWRTASAGLVESCPGQTAWAPSPTSRATEPPAGMLFTYLNVDSKAYPDYYQAGENPGEDSVGTLVGQLFGGFISSARSKELYTLVESEPRARDRMRHSQNYYPRTADHLRAFFGFFERDFRVFDFYQGMYDARRDFIKHLGEDPDRAAAAGTAAFFKYPEATWFTKTLQLGKTAPHSWAPFLCLRSVYDRRAEWSAYCAGDALKNFRILTQTALDRLYSRCREAAAAGHSSEWKDHADCRRASAGEPPPRIVALPSGQPQGWQRTPHESDFRHAMRLFSLYRFHFRDLELDSSQSESGLTEIKTRLLAATDRFAARQPFTERMLLKFTGKPIADLLRYTPTESLLYLTVGRAWEAGVSTAYPRVNAVPSWLRTNVALQVQGIHTLLSSVETVVAVTPAAGLEFDLGPLNNATMQWRAGLRYGYQLSFKDDFGRGECTWNDEGGSIDPASCTRSVVQPLVSLSFWERVRFMLVSELYPTAPEMKRKPWNVLFGAGLEM